MSETKLSDKQQRFCDEYLVDLNATQAAIRAGYSERSAYSQGQRLLKHDEAKAYIKKRMEEKQTALVADQDEVLRYLTAVLRGETESEVVVVEGTGNGASEARGFLKKPDEKERLKAAELLGKRYSLFTDRVEQEVDMSLNITVDYGDTE